LRKAHAAAKVVVHQTKKAVARITTRVNSTRQAWQAVKLRLRQAQKSDEDDEDLAELAVTAAKAKAAFKLARKQFKKARRAHAAARDTVTHTKTQLARNKVLDVSCQSLSGLSVIVSYF
jgi:hypothetical protein